MTIAIAPGIMIPDEELEFVASRSGGPGGQNVNKVSSRVTLRFDLEKSSAFTPGQRERIRAKLASRINKEGVLQVTSQRSRSQEFNREDACEIFAELVRSALHQEKKRVPTRVTRTAKEQRLEEKKKHTQLKKARSTGTTKGWDD